MAITPMEINNKEFKKGFRGYDIDDVDDFLEQVVEDYEKLYKENAALREKLSSLTEKLEHYTKIEATLQNTLILAQGAADQAKSNSQKEAELIIKNANDTAQRIIDQAHTEVVKITSQYEKAKQEFQLFKSKYKSFIQTQLDLLSEIDTLPNEPVYSVNDNPQRKNSEPQVKNVNSENRVKEVIQDANDEIASTANLDGGADNNYQDGEDINYTRAIEFKPKTMDFSGKFNDYRNDDNNTY
jgi:DivIVA domain